jgi:hypothetical protein
MAIRTLYLQESLSITGRHALGGRALYDRFRELSEEALLGHVVYTDADADKIKELRLKEDMVTEAVIREMRPNVVFMEGGLFFNDDDVWKLPVAMATKHCEAGAF